MSARRPAAQRPGRPRRALWRFARQAWALAPRALTGGMALAVATLAAGSALLALSGWFITAAAIAGGQMAAGAGAALVLLDVFMPSAGIRLLALARTGARYAERLLTHAATLAVLLGLRDALFAAWSGPRAAARLARRPARWLFRLTQDVQALESLYLRVAVPLAASVAAAALTAAALAAIDWRLGAAAALALGGAAAALFAGTARRAVLPAARRAVALERLRAHAIDQVAGQTEWLLAGQAEAAAARGQRADARLARADDALNRIDVGGAWAQQALHGTLLAAALLAASALALRGQIGAALAALVLLLALAAAEPWPALRRGALELGHAVLAARRLQAAWPASPHPGAAGAAGAPGAAATAVAAAAPAPLRLHGVSFSYAERQDLGSNRPLSLVHAPFLAIDLVVEPGQRVALAGPSGSGKSTLLALLAGELRPATGTLSAPPAAWLTQSSELFAASVRDNLDLRAEGLSDQRLWWALAQVALADDIRRSPRGLDTPLGEGGLGLSGGQARRLALARLLLSPAPLWLLDEPTEGLDAATARRVMASLWAAAGTRTVVLATHRQREAEGAQRLIALAHGRVQADSGPRPPGNAPADAHAERVFGTQWQRLRADALPSGAPP